MAYPIVFEDGRWFPGLGLFELSGPVHEEGYRTGWLRKDFAGPRGDPADRVSGGPEHWSDVDRHELAGTFRELWRVSGPQAAVRVLDGGKIDAQQAHGFDLYHAALDATGKRGRLVVGDEKWTVIVPLVHDGSAWQIGSGSGQTRKRAPREEDRDGSLEIPASPELTEARKEAAAAKVVGGAPNASTTARALLAEEVEGLWKRIVATAETEPNPDVRAMTLAPSHRTRWTAMSNAERKALREASRAGIVFQDPQDKWLAGFGLVWVVIDTGTDRARVVRANSSMKLSFPIVREEGRWHPALGYVEVVDGTTDEEDRSGWIGPPLVGPRMDPAARVTGGPATLTDADRHAIVRALDTRWRGGQDVAADALKAGGMGPTEGAQFRLYHVALDADGKNGRLVLGDAGRALVLPIALEGGGWSVLGKGGETRNSPPGPDDRDGYLHR
jgi:hypothetical protein